MLALLQRVNYARIVVEGECIADMQKGILAFIAFERGDTPDKAKKMFDKILKLCWYPSLRLQPIPAAVTVRVLIRPCLRLKQK